MKKVLAWTFLGIAIVVGAAACKDNPKATEACKDSHDSGTCDKCCHSNGASGYKYMGDGCGCLN